MQLQGELFLPVFIHFYAAVANFVPVLGRKLYYPPYSILTPEICLLYSSTDAQRFHFCY